MRLFHTSRAVMIVLMVLGLGSVSTGAEKEKKSPDNDNVQGTVHTVEARVTSPSGTGSGTNVLAEKQPGYSPSFAPFSHTAVPNWALLILSMATALLAGTLNSFANRSSTTRSPFGSVASLSSVVISVDNFFSSLAVIRCFPSPRENPHFSVVVSVRVRSAARSFDVPSCARASTSRRRR